MSLSKKPSTREIYIKQKEPTIETHIDQKSRTKEPCKNDQVNVLGIAVAACVSVKKALQ